MSPPSPLELPVGTDDASALDLILGRDPAGSYAAMDAPTRERYRQACRQLAAWANKTPLAVAHEALQLSEAHEAGDARGRHVGTSLLAEGRPLLEARLGCRVPWRVRAARKVRRHAPEAYVGALVVLLALALMGVERALAAWGVARLHRLLLAAFLTPSLLEFLQDQLNAVLSRFVPELTPLPRLEPQGVLTPETRTLVVTPLLVTSVEDIQSQLRMMEINALGNDSPELLFALLTDFRDAPQKELPGEQELLERLEQGVRELNARHGHSGQPRFFFLHRERRWNPVAGRWMGWERKRGKLEELNRLVLGARDTSYTGPVPEVVHTVRYILTLDADSHLVPGSAAGLVATLHHPLNRPRFDASGHRLRAGLSMLQPAMADGPNRAQWLAMGPWPVSLVRERKRAEPERPWALLQRLFGIGDFLGKGLYDVAAFARCLEGRLPENAILSHDKLEGMFARVAFVHDIHVFERQANGFAVFARVLHRWTRGDWQLLPWILPWVPSQSGRRVRNTLSVLDRWRLMMDLCRSLHYPSSLLVLVCGWLWLPRGGSWAWTLGGTLWVCRHMLLFTLGQLFQAVRQAPSFLAGLRGVASSLLELLRRVVFNVAAILPSSALLLDAIFRALYRLAFDRRRMLDWTTHAQAAHGTGGLRATLALPEVYGAAVLALAITGALAAFNPRALPWACPLLLGWIPMVVMVQRHPSGPPPGAQASPQREPLRALARGLWTQYAQWGPTDASGGEMEATPTDFALWLVAPLSAYHLGALPLDGLLSRLGDSLTFLAGLERARGHLLARYELRERRPVGPRHLSTAESGVLAAALVVVESGLRAARMGTSDTALRARLEDVEARARALREGMDFTFLYDAKLDLFHTGYDVESGALSGTHHGLLTSGAMLAGYVAIARKQVPLRHWLALAASDQRLRAEGALALGQSPLAEHLLPTLFLWFPPHTLLSQAALAVLSPPVPSEPPLSLLALRFQSANALAGSQGVAPPERALSTREQALTLAGVANVVCDDILIQHFHQHWQTAWVEALVYETQEAP